MKANSPQGWVFFCILSQGDPSLLLGFVSHIAVFPFFHQSLPAHYYTTTQAWPPLL